VRAFFTISVAMFFLFPVALCAQKDKTWQKLEGGVEVMWINKKKVKNTDYSIWKLKVRNTSDHTLNVKFSIYEYQGATLIARSEEENYCLKPNFMEVVKIQLLESKSDSDLEVTRELKDVSVEAVDACE
jgi:hypothetical protein